MKRILLLSLLCLASFSKAQTITRLLAVGGFDSTLRILDTNTYATIASKPMACSTIGMGSGGGFNGLSKKPNTGVFYTVIRNNSGTRYLATLNPATGSVTSIGNLNNNFIQITFNGNNTLLGITGPGGSTINNTVFRINPTNAATSSLQTVAGTGGGQLICYNPVNNKIYHWYDTGSAFEYSDTSYVTTTTVSANLGSSSAFGAAVYKTNSSFVNYDHNLVLRKTHATGSSSVVAAYPTTLKGLAYITCSRTITPATPQTACTNGSTVTLTMSGTVGATYQWFKNNTAIPGATLSTLNTNTTLAGYYKCLINDGCGQDSLAPGVTLTLSPTPTVAITGSTFACSGNTIQLVGSSGGTSQWYQNGAIISGANTNSYVVSTAGVYNMIKTNLNGCKDSASIGKVVVIGTLPTLSVSSNSSSICAGQSVSLTVNGAVTYSWNTGATSASIVVSPTVTTTYSVIGTGSNGCSKTATVTQIVNNCTGINEIATLENSISIYPNPNSGAFTIDILNATNISLVDILGKTIYSEFLMAGKHNIVLNNFKSGIYILKGETTNGTNKSIKLIIKD